MSLTPTIDAFWSARDAWASRRLSAQAATIASGGKVESDASLSRLQRYWAKKAGKPTKPGKKGGFSFAFRGDEIREIAAGIAAAGGEALIYGIDVALGEAAFKSWREWPVRSGFSKSNLDTIFLADERRLTGRYSSLAPYTFRAPATRKAWAAVAKRTWEIATKAAGLASVRLKNAAS